MGKTNPTYRQLLDEWIDSYEYYRRGLRPNWKPAFDDVLDGAKQHAAASYANPIQPEIHEYAIVSICLEQQRQINQFETELEEVKRLTGDLARVTDFSELNADT